MIRLWDVKTGRLLRRVDLPGAGVLSLAWLADGRGVALLQTGADPTRRDSNGGSAADAAEQAGFPELARVLRIGESAPS